MRAARIVMCSIFILFCILTGCNNQKETEVSFTATVLEINQSSILVEPAEGSVELSSADRIVAYVDDAMIIDSQGNEIDLTAIQAGNQVVIYYDGLIAESYPAQIRANKVQLVE